MTTYQLADLMSVATKDQENNIEVLKKTLQDNNYKVCGMGAELMLDQMFDMGLDVETVSYWKTLAFTHLPYSPSEAIK